jgi:pyruvate dehydrogenase E2 component (dihydrolipoamide acetyltransferase)
LPTNVIMPALGVAQQTGKLLKWLKTEGQSVTRGEPLMEIETDKATLEIEAPGSGVLAHVTASPGDEIPVGNRIAVILAPGEVLSPAAPHAPRKDDAQGEGGAATPKPSPLLQPAAPILSSHGRLLASPAAKRLAREKGISLAGIKGSGPEGSVLARDILLAAPEQPPASTAEDVVPLTSMRRIVGERMVQSKQSAPHFYLSVDVDMGAVQKLRVDCTEQGDSAIPSINDFILYACAGALKVYPSVNASFAEQGIKQHPYINLGVAVALEEGLVVPVIRHADRLSLSELAAESRKLIDKAQRKKLFPLDYEGGTFTVSNLGMLGVDSFTAIINPPQCAILAIGRVAPRVVAEEGMFAIKSLMTATLSADHRVIDGAIAARFLREIKSRLESGSS